MWGHFLIVLNLKGTSEFCTAMRIKTHLDNALHLSSLWSDLSMWVHAVSRSTSPSLSSQNSSWFYFYILCKICHAKLTIAAASVATRIRPSFTTMVTTTSRTPNTVIWSISTVAFATSLMPQAVWFNPFNTFSGWFLTDWLPSVTKKLRLLTNRLPICAL